MQNILICISLSLILSGCADFLSVYRIDVPQGNVITQEEVNQLKPGMTQRQVSFLLGSPLMEDPFHQDRWDYINQRVDEKGAVTSYKLSVTFKNGGLIDAEGSFEIPMGL